MSLARSGVNPSTAMELMRHSDIRLTTAIYHHPFPPTCPP